MFGLTAAIFAGLLIVTGIAKTRRPLDTSRALAAIGLPDHRVTGLILGVTEIAIGTGVIATFSRGALMAQGALYAVFTGWIVYAIQREVPITSCGCLGTPDTPPYAGHLAVDSLAASTSFAAAFLAGPEAASGWFGITATVVVVTVGTFLAWAVIGDGARLYGARL